MKTSLVFLIVAFLCVFFPFEGQNRTSGKVTLQVNNTPNDSVGLVNTPLDGVYGKMAITQQGPIPYPYLREADIVWTKRVWRMIDLREKINQPFYFPEIPRNDYMSLAQLIWDNVMNQSIAGVYNTKNDQFTITMTLPEIVDNSESVDTLKTKHDSAGFDVYTYEPIHYKFAPTDVKKFLIKEDWYFDRQRSVFEVRILGICPITKKRIKGKVTDADNYLFWIYFPECRKLFSHYEVFNLKNGVAGRLTYDDVFMKRMFSSYVVKEENVYDRSIDEYAKGVAALLESEKAKNTLFEFEQNLWEY